MGHVSRNTAAVVALLVVLHVANGLPLNKDGGNGKGKGGKGKGGDLTDAAEDNYGSLLDAFVEAHGQEETADFILADQGREKRDADEPSALVSADGAYDGDALVADEPQTSALNKKKACRGNRAPPSDGGTTNTDAEGASESEDLARQREKGGNKKNKKRGSKGKGTATATEEPSELKSFFMDADFPSEDW